MKFVIATVLGTLICLGGYKSALADPPGPPLTLDVNVTNLPLTEYRIVGFTTASTNGFATAMDALGEVNGIDAMDQKCANDFGPNSRAALSDEQLAPTITRSDIPAAAWVQPTRIQIIHLADAPDTNDWAAYDIPSGADSLGTSAATPLADALSLNCKGYASDGSGNVGLIRSLGGRIMTDSCFESHRVACSAPVQVAITP